MNHFEPSSLHMLPGEAFQKVVYRASTDSVSGRQLVLSAKPPVVQGADHPHGIGGEFGLTMVRADRAGAIPQHVVNVSLSSLPRQMCTVPAKCARASFRTPVSRLHFWLRHGSVECRARQYGHLHGVRFDQTNYPVASSCCIRPQLAFVGDGPEVFKVVRADCARCFSGPQGITMSPPAHIMRAAPVPSEYLSRTVADDADTVGHVVPPQKVRPGLGPFPRSPARLSYRTQVTS